MTSSRQVRERTWVVTHRGITGGGLCCIVLEMWMSMSLDGEWAGVFPSLSLRYNVERERGE